MALGESASQLRLVHGFEDEFEFEDDCPLGYDTHTHKQRPSSGLRSSIFRS